MSFFPVLSLLTICLQLMAAASHNEAILHHRQNPNIIKTKATLAHKYLSVSIPYHQSSSRLSQQRSNVFTNDLTSHRPSIIIGPNPPYNAMPQSPARTRKCEVACDGRSDEMHLEQAIQNCNNGGHIVLAASQSCIMSREMRLENLQNIDIELQGNISFKCNPNGHAPLMSLQGVDVNLYGNGTIDGGGPQYWKKGKNSVRPNLLEISLDGGSVIGLHLADPPMMFVILRTSRNVLVSNLYLEAKARGTLQAYNSDGIDPSDSTNIVIQNSVIENDDDCVAIKAGSSFIVVQGLRCINSHGISIGSLGQRPLDTVEHVKVTNCEFEGGLAAARIKTLSGNNDGLISDVQYANIHVHNVVNAIEVNQCYETLKTCHSNPSGIKIHNFTLSNFTGIAQANLGPKLTSLSSGLSAPRDKFIGMVSCGSYQTCMGISMHNIDVKSTSDLSGKLSCTNFDDDMCM